MCLLSLSVRVVKVSGCQTWKKTKSGSFVDEIVVIFSECPPRTLLDPASKLWAFPNISYSYYDDKKVNRFYHSGSIISD